MASNPAMPFGQPQPQSWLPNKRLVKHIYAMETEPHVGVASLWCSGSFCIWFGLGVDSGPHPTRPGQGTRAPLEAELDSAIR